MLPEVVVGSMNGGRIDSAVLLFGVSLLLRDLFMFSGWLKGGMSRCTMERVSWG